MDMSPPHPPLKNEYITTASSEKLPTGHRNNTQFYTIMFWGYWENNPKVHHFKM